MIPVSFPSFKRINFSPSLSCNRQESLSEQEATSSKDVYKRQGLYSGVSGQNVWAGTLQKAWHGEGTSNDIPRLSYNDLKMCIRDRVESPVNAFIFRYRVELLIHMASDK